MFLNSASFAVTALVSTMLISSCGNQQKIHAFNFETRKKVEAHRGAVVSASPIASEVGVSILKQGGNAIDAAIATQLALAVVHPSAGNIGGGGFTIIHLKSGKNIAIDYREKAPAKASRDMYLDSNGNADLNLSQNSPLAVGVPGSVAGIFACMKYAKLPFKKLIQPAIDLAAKGFVLVKGEAYSLNSARNHLINVNETVPAYVKKTFWKEGDTLIQKDLANTLKRIRDYGAKGFYEGETARLFAEQMKRDNGLITQEDLKNYEAKERAPVEFDYRGNTVVSMPLPSSGGIILEQLLKMSAMKHIDTMHYGTLSSVQLMSELERRVFADRAKYLGDPDFVKVPVKTLLSDDYLKKRLSDYDPTKAGNSRDTKEGYIIEGEETTHFDVIDKDGNAVSVTTTLNGSFGCGIVVKDAGFLLNNEMDDFSAKPGVPNMFGAVGAEANAIAPGKRMLSSMTPTIVLKNNQPYIVVGTPGGTTIPTSVYQTIVDIIDFKMTPKQAVDSPKFHQQWLPDVIYVERNFNPKTLGELDKMGYEIKKRSSIGRTEVIEVEGNKFIAVADSRGDDGAVGY
jgi:gamma-glutamyltranspeptidase/glutathione hydrolase